METLITTPEKIIAELKKHRIVITNEMYVQRQLFKVLCNAHFNANYNDKTCRLDDENIIDLMVDGVGIEVKIKGGAKEIFYQCERYCGFDQVKQLILVTNKVMTLPKEICGKQCFVYNLSNNWL